ncbi:putative transmembrane protein [Toxoplasma gondii RUB]|uniref:Putative transmembrane protein n=1 Tax=Toxoplasma gondii RUB TaxID=935652 RepID=A0A086LWU4_TOXGO|nr:putative transmembrane protein [Toxoplasma gondii RUB]
MDRDSVHSVETVGGRQEGEEAPETRDRLKRIFRRSRFFRKSRVHGSRRPGDRERRRRWLQRHRRDRERCLAFSFILWNAVSLGFFLALLRAAFFFPRPSAGSPAPKVFLLTPHVHSPNVDAGDSQGAGAATVSSLAAAATLRAFSDCLCMRGDTHNAHQAVQGRQLPRNPRCRLISIRRSLCSRLVEQPPVSPPSLLFCFVSAVTERVCRGLDRHLQNADRGAGERRLDSAHSDSIYGLVVRAKDRKEEADSTAIPPKCTSTVLLCFDYASPFRHALAYFVTYGCAGHVDALMHDVSIVYMQL